jgi:hypothetical protein
LLWREDVFEEAGFYSFRVGWVEFQEMGEEFDKRFACPNSARICPTNVMNEAIMAITGWEEQLRRNGDEQAQTATVFTSLAEAVKRQSDKRASHSRTLRGDDGGSG